MRVKARRTGVGLLALTLGCLAAVPGCSRDEDPKKAEETQLGRVKLPLQTIGSAGNVYRLRNAVFRISSVQSGEVIRNLRTERDPFTSLISADVPSGEHSVHLQEGWFLERVSSNGGGFGGAGGAAGGFPPFDDGDFDDEPFPGGGTFGGDGDIFIGDGDGDGDIFVGDGDGDGDGFFEFGEEVPAQLLSDAIQLVDVEPREDEFVLYTFRVGDEIVQFGEGSINIGIQVIEDDVDPGPSCPDEEQIHRRAVFETVRAATSGFSMEDVFQSLSDNAGLNTSGQRLYQEIIDSYATADEAQLPGAIHCGDEQTNGQASLNGFPIECNRQERLQFDNLDSFFATAVVNRLDLAPENGAHCGQQRVIFASNALNRMFFIFESQIPNPEPNAGLEGCRPIAEFWAEQASIDNPEERGDRLRQAFLDGSPELAEGGFGPFMTAQNLTAGSGQIRTNQFDSAPWTLREFKLATSGNQLRAVPFPVAEAPNGALWNDSVDTPQGAECREAFLESMQHLLSDDPAEMSFPIPEQCRDSESRNDFSQNYAGHLLNGDPSGFQAQLAGALEGTGLSPVDIANRAHFAGSCIGCHEEAVGRDLGNGVTSPFSAGFVHVDEFGGGDCEDGPCFGISQALRNVFLPHRLEILSQFVSLPYAGECGGGGMGGAPGAGGGFGMGGSVRPPVGTGGAVTFPFPQPPQLPGTDEPAPVIEIELPRASMPIERMLNRDRRIRAQFGDETIGGQVAQQSH